MNTIENRQLLQSIILLFIGIGIAVYLLALYKKRIRSLVALAPLSWLFHASIFYAVVVGKADHTPSVFFTSWSSILRLQTVITIVAIGIIALWRNGNTE